MLPRGGLGLQQQQMETRSVTKRLNELQTPSLPALIPGKQGSFKNSSVSHSDSQSMRLTIQQGVDNDIANASLSSPAQRHTPIVPREPVGHRSNRPSPSPMKNNDDRESSLLPELNLSPRGTQLISNKNSSNRLEHSVSDLAHLPTNSIQHQYRPLDIGLENLGNSCFMNTSLQCLLHVEPLVSYFLHTNIDSCINSMSPFKGQLARAFALLCREMTALNQASYNPAPFQRAVASLAPQLLDYQQQDCQEFLRFLLDGISEDLCRPVKIISPPSVSSVSIEGIKLGHSSQSPPVKLAPINTQSTSSSPSNRPQQTALTAPNAECVDSIVGRLSSLDITADSSSSTYVGKQNLPGPVESDTFQSEWDDSTSSLLVGSPVSLGNHIDPPNTSDSQSKSYRYRSRRVVQRDPNNTFNNAEVSTNSSGKSYASKTVILSSSSSGGSDGAGNSAIEIASTSSPAVTLSTDESSIPSVEADKAWSQYLEKNNSVISDIFAGQLQSTIECTHCKHRSICFDPFLDLSVPLPKGEEGRGLLRRDPMCTLHDCLSKFTAPEVLDGDNMYTCENCKIKRKCTKKLSLYKFPRLLIVHIKRFRFSAISREKLGTDVSFPVLGLDLAAYGSDDRPVGGELCGTVYDLMGVSNHSGGLHGGHYIAHCDINAGLDCGSKWMCFNDARASQATANSFSGPSAYVLFYRRRDG